MEIKWDEEKNEILKQTRGLSFYDVVDAINSGEAYKTVAHPNKEKYPNQDLLLIKLNGYMHVVPFVENDDHIFLKTIFPSRKHNKGEINDEKR